MLELVIRPHARRDLKGIWKYTLNLWGATQADKYLEDIDHEIHRLLEFPEMGIPCEQVRAGYRVLHVKHHLVFYLRKKQTLEIVRVLHEATDVGSHT